MQFPERSGYAPGCSGSQKRREIRLKTERPSLFCREHLQQWQNLCRFFNTTWLHPGPSIQLHIKGQLAKSSLRGIPQLVCILSSSIGHIFLYPRISSFSTWSRRGGILDLWLGLLSYQCMTANTTEPLLQVVYTVISIDSPAQLQTDIDWDGVRYSRPMNQIQLRPLSCNLLIRPCF